MKRSTVILAAALGATAGATALNVALYAAWHDATGYALGLYRRNRLLQHDLGELRTAAVLSLPDQPSPAFFEPQVFPRPIQDHAIGVSHG